MNKKIKTPHYNANIFLIIFLININNSYANTLTSPSLSPGAQVRMDSWKLKGIFILEEIEGNPLQLRNLDCIRYWVGAWSNRNFYWMCSRRIYAWEKMATRRSYTLNSHEVRYFSSVSPYIRVKSIVVGGSFRFTGGDILPAGQEEQQIGQAI